MVSMMNALIEFVQEIKSEAILKSFLNLVPSMCMVVRDSKISSIDAAELVPGDVVNIRLGDKVPADVFILWSQSFKVLFHGFDRYSFLG